MKAASSKSESKKRKRADSQEPITESTKKAKVHAQRKFAQGAAFNSPVITPIKDKVRPPAAVSSSGPILTGKCPNTEDFLTFLCFRRTSILPAKLDFFKDAFGSESESATSTDKAHSSVNHKSNSDQSGKQNSKKSDKNEEGKKSQAPAVQALRKKYQEQRLAKQKPTNVTRLAKKVKGKNMVRTRSSAVAEETKTAVKKPIEKEVTKTNASGLRSGLKRIQPTVKKIMRKPIKAKHLRTGLRSGGSIPETPTKSTQELKSNLIAVKKSEKEAKKSKMDVPETKAKANKAKKTEGFSDFSSDDNEPLLAVKKPKMGAKTLGKSDGGKHQNKAAVKTRSQVNEPEVSAVLLRPTRKTKEAAALYMEMITKKLVSPEKSGDEDMSSVDSFPELPNAKRMEQRETEIRAKAFAPKKTEPKQQSEDKGKETKKTLAKKNEQITKTETKSSKDSSLKKGAPKKESKATAKQDESKGDTSSVKRPTRTIVKEEPTKAKQAEEEKKEQTRPSTRSRPQEIVSQSKKQLVKTFPKHKQKNNPEQKEAEKRPTDKAAEVGKKSKTNKEEKTKPKSEVDSAKKQKEQESSSKALDSRKMGDKKANDKNEIKEKVETVKKRGRKPLKPVESDIQSKKPKAAEKKSKKEEEKVDGVGVNKRPTRKCSTVDKIWIDIDGFTSDEDDYLEITKTKGSMKKGNSGSDKPHQKMEYEKKLNKPEVNVSDKTKNEKAKESGQKVEEKKPELKKNKVESNFQEEALQAEGKKSETKGKSEEGGKTTEKRENAKMEKKEKAEVKQSSDSKKNEKSEQEDEKRKTKESHQQAGKQKENEKGGKKEAIKNTEGQKKVSENDKGEKKEVIKETDDQKKVLRKPKRLRSSWKEKEEEAESKKRTRPVRQCSTGEKRWIETDSDSFSFYETSDDEDNLPILDFSKVKSSPDAKDSKTPGEGKKESKTPGEGKKESKMSGEGKKENKTLGEGKKENKTLGEGKKESKTLGEGKKESKMSGEGKKENKTLGEGKKESKMSGEGKKEKTLGEGKKESKMSGEGKKENKTLGEGKKESKMSGEGKKENKTLGEGKKESKMSGEGKKQSKTLGERKKESKMSVEGKKESKTLGEGKKENKTLGEGKKENKTLGEGKKESKMSVEGKKENKTLGESKKESKTLGEGKKESKIPGEGKKESKIPGEGKKESKTPGEGKKESKIPGDGKKESKTQKEEDNFSESDEEPLKKKAHIEEISKNPEPEFKSLGKTQREVPGLTPLKKPSVETHVSSPPDIPPGSKPGQLDPSHMPVVIPTEKPLFYEVKTPEERIQPVTVVKQIEIPKFLPEPSPVSVPNRIEMILHSLKRDKMVECSASCSNDVKVTFGTVPYSPMAHSSQMNQIPCTYQVKATFPSPREPISTHGLDLLSEVALPTTPKENISSQTKRIEKWLNDSLAADQKARFSYDNIEYKTGSQSVPDKPHSEVGYYFGKTLPNQTSKGVSSHSEFHKFGQVELIESQKLLKKNLFAAEVKQDANRVEQQQQTTPKKTLTSVQDLLKLQKERKEISKSTENAPHLKNCKCNNCIVKKGWFKNKPVPKTEQLKSSPVEEQEETSKPFESLTKAFIGEGKNSKMSVSVAPMVVLTSPTPSCSKDGAEKKGTFQQKKLSFLERMKERERKEAAAKSKLKAFSPSNERSVYAFEPEPKAKSNANASFRKKTRESRTSSTSRSDDEGLKICEDETPTASSGTQMEKPTADKAKSSQSASIAVQVNLDSEAVAEAEPPPELQDGKSIEISTQTEVPEEDSDSPMFYIPLQQATPGGASASSEQQLIQGVALKLGTEGPMGPNQRVIMKAKLVTKPPDSPSIKAVVMPQPKRMFDQKYNNPPIGTVQPTTRKPPDEPVGDKSESAKPVVSPAKESPEPVPQPSEGEVSKTTKNTPTGKPLKNKEKTQNVAKEKPEVSDENSPSSSTSSSSKTKRPSKQKSTESVINPTNSTWLPPAGTSSKLVEAPTFHPTEKDFQDPFEFFDRIRPAAEKFGLCRIVPPSNFKPDCKVSDDMRFTAYNQYVHRMFHRWGPNIKEMMAIKKYLATQSISLKQPPWIGGIEVDLPRLYQSVQNCGGLMKVMEKKKWHQVADTMKIPKAAQDRVTKLDDIYCKYLLPYDTLSHDERQKLFDEVEKDWEERQKTPVESQDSQEDEDSEENYIEECEECVVKGRNMALNQFYRIARNTMSMWFRNPEPSPREVEAEFWKHVSERNHHVCVHSGSIDSSGWGYGFPVAKNNAFSKHPWNLKVLTNNSGSVLRYLGPVMGVTVPTLHVGMVFTAFCWYRDPHGLPWIEYLHTGAPKIWYGISDDNSTVFQEALTKLLPRYIKNKTIWLPSDTAMIPPELLVEHGVSLCHTVQEPGQFILVFPRAFTSSICTGYLVSESVYFAQLSWLATAEQVFKDIQESCEPSMFSLEKLLFSIATDSRSSAEVLKQVLPMVWHVRQKEIDGRKTLFNLGLKSLEKLPAREPDSKKKKGRWAQEDGDYECEICRTNLYVSLVTNSQEEGVYCLPHAIDLLTQKRHQLKYCKLMYTYTQEEMNEMVEKLEQRIESKCQKKPQSKPSTSAK